VSSDPHSVGDILDRLHDLGRQNLRVSVGEVVEAFGSRSYGPFLLVPPLLEESPLGAIPGVPTVTAAVVALFAVQIVLGREHMWLPGLIRNRSTGGERVVTAINSLRPLARWADRWFHGRLAWLTEGVAVRVAAALCLFLCLTVPPLEVLPWASSAPMLAIAAVGLALLVRDGALMIAAWVIGGVGVAVGLGWLAGGGASG
jgi:hypothetical protein